MSLKSFVPVDLRIEGLATVQSMLERAEREREFCAAMASGNWVRCLGLAIYFAAAQRISTQRPMSTATIVYELLSAWHLNDGSPPNFRTWWAQPTWNNRRWWIANQ